MTTLAHRVVLCRQKHVHAGRQHNNNVSLLVDVLPPIYDMQFDGFMRRSSPLEGTP